jgi:tRNA-dihydrouridine synthase 1
MVGASDLAFRLLCRNHGADTCYTEMFFSDRFAADPEYRALKLQTCPQDRPLVVQFCGNQLDTLLAAAKLAEPHCDGIDINLGCPLPQAQEQLFGAYLLDEEHWDLLVEIVAGLAAALSVPVLCKIRLLPSIEDTIRLCKRLEEAGCSLIAVHGRIRPLPERRKQRAGPADLDAIKLVCDAVSIPVLTNGNTVWREDVEYNLAYTGAAGIMSGEGVLVNPLLFEKHPDDYEPSVPELRDAALEYLSLARVHSGAPMSWVRSHIMWMLGRSGKGHRCVFEHLGPFTSQQLRCALVDSDTLEQFEQLVRQTLCGD